MVSKSIFKKPMQPVAQQVDFQQYFCFVLFSVSFFCTIFFLCLHISSFPFFFSFFSPFFFLISSFFFLHVHDTQTFTVFCPTNAHGIYYYSTTFRSSSTNTTKSVPIAFWRRGYPYSIYVIYPRTSSKV